MRIRNILNLKKYFNIYIAITSCYKLSAAMNYFLHSFPGMFWCARVIWFLRGMNIQQIILLADDRHVLVNKRAHNLCPRSSLLQSGPQYILPTL